MDNMNWKLWKLGCLVSLFMSLLVAGTTLATHASWITFFAVLCSSAVTHFGAFLNQHPIEKIEFETTVTTTKTTVKDTSTTSVAPTPTPDVKNN